MVHTETVVVIALFCTFFGYAVSYMIYKPKRDDKGRFKK